METENIPIISVTGTKGKTTVVSIIADILRRSKCNVLHVDTSGHFVNGERRSVAADSMHIWGIRTVTAMPGKYLGSFLCDQTLQQSPVAVLECSFSCKSHGLGYATHKVGVFLNVFEDHIDPRGPIKNKQDLAEAKSFIFSSIADNGYAVFNADDEFVCGALRRIPRDKHIQFIPCGLSFEHFDLPRHLAAGGVAITVETDNVVLKSASQTTVLCALKVLPWTFNGSFTPSVMNMLHACGAVYGFFDGKLPKDSRELFDATRLSPQTGRLVVTKAANGTVVIGDYAHEKQSLKAIASLGRSLIEGSGKLIGVVRLAHERSDESLQDTSRTIAEAFDEVVVYDKIDGYWRKPGKPVIKRYPQVVGRTSEIVAAAIKERNSNVTRILREDEAIAFAAKRASSEDVVVVILNDNISRSLDFIKQEFHTEEV
ncbi:MAG TPA: Mur ligase family protein [Candidatus Saccharimonadales bacterium]|nr:Mur ligase family protein [Candidatus Saccharimonadales bacterium]